MLTTQVVERPVGFTRVMAGLEDVLQRVANDRSFADAVRSDPTNALRGYQLDPSELARLERVVGAAPSWWPTAREPWPR